MNKTEVVNAIGKYFKIQELVDEPTYKKYGDWSWNFFNTKLLENLLVIRRDILKVPLVINDWCYGGKNSQRGLRTNLSYLVKEKTDKGIIYLTTHNGNAVDFVSSKMSADEMRKLIKANARKLPNQCRVEDAVSAPTWLHLDCMEMVGQKDKVYFFKA